jgi:phosphatidate cytidylyltransferase
MQTGAAGGSPFEGRNLAVRVASAALLAPLAIVTAYLGGWPFMLLWALAAIGVLWEWIRLVAQPLDRHAFLTGLCTIAASAALMALNRPIVAILIIALGALGAAAVSSLRRPAWIAGGVAYAGLMMAAPVRLRADAESGFVALLFIFAVVWATDTFAYFAGRTFGGPKLAPAISPNKTWSGALGGAIAAVVFALLVASFVDLRVGFPLAAVALALSVVAQAGDLLKSSVKRRFGVKDSSHLIPGHGGLMDRLDGFWAVAVVSALFGMLRGGLDAPARGLVVW